MVCLDPRRTYVYEKESSEYADERYLLLHAE